MPKTKIQKTARPTERNRSRVSFEDWPEELQTLLDENERSTRITQEDLDVTTGPAGTITVKDFKTIVR